MITREIPVAEYLTSASHLLSLSGAQGLAQQATEHVEQAATSEVSRRRMLPFAGWSDVSTELPRLLKFDHAPTSNPSSILRSPHAVAATAPSPVPSSADDIVERATAVLMQEMTTPHIVPSWSDAPMDATGTWVEKAHGVVEQIADLWRAAQASVSTAVSTAAPGALGSEVPAFEAQQRVRPGAQANVLLTLQNREQTTATLRPVATDLLGSRGCAIPSGAVRFTPAVSSLNPGEDADLTITVNVPASATPGCYTGLIVVVGTEYLRALITLDVE